MANTKSAIKRIKTSEKRHQRNVAVKSATRTFIRKARQTIASAPGEAQAEVTAAISALDRAARKGIIHPNNAARRKSRLIKRLNAAAAALTAAPVETEEAAAPKTRRRTATKAKATQTKKAAKSEVAAAPETPEEKPKRTRKPKAAS